MSIELVMPSNHLMPFSSCLQPFPASGSFPVSQFFASGGRSIGASALHQSFQWIFRIDFLQVWLVWSLCSPRYVSVQFSHSVMSDSATPWRLASCPSPTPRVYPNSCPLSWWCHPTISSSVIPFSSFPNPPQSFPASGLIQWGGQSIGVSTSSSVLPMNTQDWSPLGWTGWISLQSKGLSRVFSNTTV